MRVSERTHAAMRLVFAFLPFWAFLALYQFAAALHYSLLSPLGERLLPLWIVGLIIGGESFGQMLLDVPAGFLVDRFGRKRMLMIGWVAFVIAAAFFLHFTLATFIASVVMSTFGWLFFSPGANAYVLSYATHETSGRFIALRDTFLSVGTVLASVALPFVLHAVPAMMGVILIMILASSFVALVLAPPDKPVGHGTHTLPAEPYHIRRTALLKTLRALARLNPASGMLCAYSFAGAIFYGAIWFVVPLVIAMQVNAAWLGVGLGIFDFSIVVLGVFIGALVDRSNKRTLVFWGLLIFTLMGMILGATLGPLFLLFGFLATTGDETAGLSLWSWLHSLDKDHAHDGAVAGAISFASDFGYAFGPVLAGFLYVALGPGWTIAVCAIPLFISWLAYTFIVHPRHVMAVLPSALIPTMPHRRRHK